MTIAYLEILKNKDESICQLARSMLQNEDMEQHDLLETFSQINGKLRESVEKDQQEEKFQQEMKIAKELFKWARTFRECLDIRKDQIEDWVQVGIEQQLGIELKNFRKSYQQLRKLIKDSSPESDKKLVVANAKFKYIDESPKDGIPVAGIPDDICGRKVTNVDGQGYNCPIRALL